MASIGRLLHKGRTLDLNAGRYSLREDFRPPGFVTSAPLDIGSVVEQAALDDDPQNRRTWDVPLVIQGSSEAEIRRALADVQDFLMNAGGDSPLYFAWRDNWGADTYDFEPKFGQQGKEGGNVYCQ